MLVSIGWVFFRAPSLAGAQDYLSAMFLLAPATAEYRPFSAYLTPDTLAFLGLGLVFAFGPFERLFRLRFDHVWLLATQLGLSSASLVYSLLLLAANSFNPFIYFRF